MLKPVAQVRMDQFAHHESMPERDQDQCCVALLVTTKPACRRASHHGMAAA
ncbi:hypothetical protein [Hydrogenophilus thermoluteolus]|jgi:hypothetical protein|uniref:hypothetical protein n=1 Tax=Hydrogenophilus thermoluteolus TaxID=297 RepID=UPI001475D62B|nr:hypothetical protein [Hydrogenophilus thermoluteolus]